LRVKLAFHDADTDTDILASMSARYVAIGVGVRVGVEECQL